MKIIKKKKNALYLKESLQARQKVYIRKSKISKKIIINWCHQVDYVSQ